MAIDGGKRESLPWEDGGGEVRLINRDGIARDGSRRSLRNWNPLTSEWASGSL